MKVVHGGSSTIGAMVDSDTSNSFKNSVKLIQAFNSCLLVRLCGHPSDHSDHATNSLTGHLAMAISSFVVELN